jgi:hypothetical protein
MKERKYNPGCVEDEVSINDTLSEELDIVSGDEMNLENEGQSASEESSNTSPESECESETHVACFDGWKDVTMGDKKLNAYTFTKNAGPQFRLLPDAESMDQGRAVDFLSMMQVFEMPPLQCVFYKITFDCDLKKKLHKNVRIPLLF